MEGIVGEEVGVVDDGDDEFAFGVERAGTAMRRASHL